MSLQEEEIFWARARSVATIVARRLGLEGDALQECVQGFLVRFLLLTRDRPVPPWEEDHSTGLVQRSAYNYATNFLRTLSAQYRRECDLNATLAQEEAEEGRQGCVLTDLSCSPQIWLLNDFFWEEIVGALARLTPIQRTLLVRHHLQGYLLEELALVAGRSVDAIKQSLSTARKRLRKVLLAQGNTEAELRAYVQASAAIMPMHASLLLDVPQKQPDEKSFEDTQKKPSDPLT